MPTRRERIEAMLESEPDDAFLRYSLALEQEQAGEHDASLAGLQSLYEEDPPYVPAFFMAGQQLARLERLEDARGVLRQGIEAARQQQEEHAAAEMSEFLANLGDAG